MQIIRQETKCKRRARVEGRDRGVYRWLVASFELDECLLPPSSTHTVTYGISIIFPTRPDAAIEWLRRTMASVMSFRLGPGQSPRTESIGRMQREVSVNAIPARHAEIHTQAIYNYLHVAEYITLSSEIPHCSQRIKQGPFVLGSTSQVYSVLRIHKRAYSVYQRRITTRCS